MKIASLGPNGAVPAQSEAQMNQYNVVDYPDSVKAPAQETPAETENPNREKAKFSRIFDILQEAQKKGKLKDSPKNKKRARSIKKYLHQKESYKQPETTGTLYKSSA